MRAVVVVATVAALVVAPAGPAVSRAAGSARAASPAPSKGTAARTRRMKAVVHAWSARLNAGDNAGVAKLFALPSVVVQGSYALRFHTRAQLAQWHSGLPCSGRVVSIAVRGRYATAVFLLGNRGSRRCDAPGTLAAARFEIVDGKIVLWVQVPVPQDQPSSGPVA
jgi:hypothetical protein